MIARVHRVIVDIDETRCDGCGDCVPSCAEGAIRVVDGKARLVGDALCDGLGACLGHCPQGAIRVTARDAVPFDHAAVERHLASIAGSPGATPRAQGRSAVPAATPTPSVTVAGPRRGLSVVQAAPDPGHGCPGARSADLGQRRPAPASPGSQEESHLSHWPVQLGLVSPRAPWLAGADLLLCADCVPFAYAGFHRELLSGRRVLVGCPKLDDLQAQAAKLAEVLSEARPRSLTVARMEVPCCGGIARAATEAVRLSGVQVALEVVTIATDGTRLPGPVRDPRPLPG